MCWGSGGPKEGYSVGLRFTFLVVFAVAVLAARPAVSAGPLAQQPRVNADAKSMAEFEKRVQEYVALHRKLEATLTSLPNEATPQQIDVHQRELGRLIQGARANAKPGDLFTPDMRRVVRRLLARVFRGPDGAQVKRSILDEYTGPARMQVNSRYPDTVPLSTVPAQVLQNLPTLPEDLEYRFVGDRLILLDSHAHIIADYVEKVFP
jgi:hypothetical protein